MGSISDGDLPATSKPKPMDARAMLAYNRRKFERAAADAMQSVIVRYIRNIPGLSLEPPVARPAGDPTGS